MQKYNDTMESTPKIEIGEEILVKKGVRKKQDPRFQETSCMQENEWTITIGKDVKRNKKKLKRAKQTISI